jgi:adenine-specific DNA-methyltransferase
MIKTIQDRMPTTPDLNRERLEQLRALMPDLFTNDGGLDPDELKRLVDPETVAESERFEFRWFGKANAKRNAFIPTMASLEYDPARSVNPELANGNAIIEGENLEVLKCLLAAYRDRIKCIYIDPPYNTGNDFVYSDTWKEDKESYWEHVGVTSNGVKIDTNTRADGRFHSNWLNMIYPRLLLARQLLAQTGYIVISIDDAELHNLRRVLDETLGEENHIATLVWDRNRKNDAKFFSVGHEYMVVYAKDKYLLRVQGVVLRAEKEGIDEVREEFEKLRKKYNDDWEKVREGLQVLYASWGDDDPRQPLARFNKVDNRGPYRDDRDSRWPGGGGPRYEVLHPATGKPCKIPSRGWVFPNAQRFWEEYDRGRIVFGQTEETIPSIRTNLFDQTTQVLRSVLFSYAQTAAQEFARLFDGRKVFDNPKHYADIRKVVEYLTDPGDIILDFFAGSGTTGHAVMQSNADSKLEPRKYILVQIPETIAEKDPAHKAGYRRISDITIDRNKRVIARLEEAAQTIEGSANQQLPGMESAEAPPYRTGFKVYRLAKSKFPRTEFLPDPEITEDENLSALEAYIRDKESAFLMTFDREEILHEVLLKRGFMLDVQTEVLADFKQNTVFRAWDSRKEATVCLDYDLKEQTIARLRAMQGIFICLEQALNTTKKWNLRAEFGERLVAF